MLPTYLQHMVSATAMKEGYWCSSAWKEITESVTQVDLDLAHSKAGIVKERLVALGITSERNPKTLERVKAKILECEKDGNYFRVVSDLMAFRVNCSVGEIDEKLALIEKLENCTFLVRSSIQITCSFKEYKREYSDIVQYVYLYFEDVGFIAELQIGHPFAMYSFEVYSRIRDGGQGVDLWTDGFYTQVRDHILDTVNRTLYSSTKEEILEKANAIHGGTVPERLLAILNDI